MDVKSAFLNRDLEEEVYMTHVSTTRFSGSKEGASCLQIEEGSIWFEVGTQGMVH
jgi:hypothetical protein